MTAQTAPGRIVVVDDAAFMRRRLRDLLEGAGYDVVAEGKEGGHALDLFEEHSPDLVTLDLVMPGMSGMEALAELRARHPDARVLICSSISEQRTLFDAIGLGARDYVLKPFEDERLLEAVEKALRDGAPGQGATR